MVPEASILPPAACPACGAPVDSDWLDAQCPRCLLGLAGEGFEETPEGRGFFGDYEILGELARGGMGVVYRARQLSLDREVALKMVRGAELADPEARRRFQREAHAAASLHHPHIVPVYETGEWEMRPYFTMRLVPGGETIAHWATRHRREPRALAAAMAQVAHAVAHAHERGVLHRDLKPSNVLWDPVHGPQVADFGLARRLDDPFSSLTQSGGILGSPAYMAPEQAAGGRAEVTTATDVHGLGAILYELLTGAAPFRGTSSAEILRRVQEEPPERPSRVMRALDRDLETICLKCLEKVPAHRYASAREVTEELERVARGEPIRASRVAVGTRAWRWARRNPTLAALVTLCAVLLLGGLAGIVWQWRGAERARAEQARALERLRWREVSRWVGEGESGRAVAWLASRLRAQPGQWQAAMYAMSVVDQNPFPVRSGPEIRLHGRAAAPPALALDGRWLVAAEAGGALRAFDADTGRERWSLAPPAPVRCVAAGEAHAAWGDAAGAVRLISAAGVASAPLRRALEAPPDELLFAADGAWLLARSAAGVERWAVADAEAGPRALTLSEAPLGVALSADGSRVLAWNAREAAAWRAADGAPLGRWTAREKFLAAALSANGACAALLDGSYEVRSFDLESGRAHPPVEARGQLFSFVALNRDGTRLTASARGHLLLLYAVDSGVHLSTQSIGGYYSDALWATPDGEAVIAVSNSDTVAVLDASRGRPRQAPLRLGVGAMSARDLHVSAARDGGRILGAQRDPGGKDDVLAIWRATREAEPRRQEVPGQRGLDGSRLSRDGSLACLGLNPSFRCYVYEVDSGRVVLDQPARGPVFVHLFSPDQTRLYAFTANGWLHGWDLRTGAELWPPNHQPGEIRPAVISDDGTVLLAGHNDGFIRAYAAATGRLLAQMSHPGEIKTLRFAPDGSGRFVSGSTDGAARVWSLRDFRCLQSFVGHQKTVLASAWSPDARRIATASYDSTVRVWEVATGQLAFPPLPHLQWMAHVEFSPDGRYLASGCRDRTARLWDARTGAPVTAPIQFSADVETVRFTPDSRALLVRYADGFVFLDVPGGEPVTVAYREPSSSGLGLDSESFRDVLTPGATGVFLGAALDYGVLWSVPQPRGTAPAWFAPALESIAGMRVDEAGEFHAAPQASVAELLARLPAEDAETPHARWLRGILAEKE